METLTLYSCIYPALKRRLLIRGVCVALLGITCFLYAAIFLPKEQLRISGPFLFLTGMGFITWGLLPYRHATRLENTPDKLIFSNETLEYYSGGKKRIEIPSEMIVQLNYYSAASSYGVKIKLKNSEKCLFFPYFSERAVKELRECL